MTTNRTVIQNADNKKRILNLRKKNFQQKLVNHLSVLGYTAIAIQYLKFGCRIWTLFLRAATQSALLSPFPSEAQIRRVTTARRNANQAASASLPGFSGLSDEIRTQIPGGESSYDLTNGISEDIEAEMEREAKSLKKKARSIIFFATLVTNLIFIFYDLLYPKNFMNLVKGHTLDEKDLTDIPSPFYTANDLVQGERRGGFFLQLIGDRLPRNNFNGNIGIILYDYAILICQFGLFILTCVNYGDVEAEKLSDQLDIDTIEEMEDNKHYKNSNGYDGNVLAAQLDPSKAIIDVLRDVSEHSTGTTYENSTMV
ncbi:hypothetical protein TBLA_0C02330 [Henningerozyma blattae CBS 6284]|uniref:DUF1746 domain-containing protein n=1 Tax=Henningerozyma blattae (strain ATCC 34711 / CBS 6284 / DSM 70876 / NBRC 10599 / NRRL Y-10934 / UCD 77-7) TaxID=1071380 RepID=I2H0Z2_HENB6|nr:hypothetical protein TBLA_0C02330 [Tetrapisispora blattae CBS 6284]CCH60044.1 hypothetical protein TBLA_0C02330 [Tetrapisispora blattae CBS 6284]